MANLCASCSEIPAWSFDENIVAFCPKAQKYVIKADECKVTEAVKKTTAKKSAKK